MRDAHLHVVDEASAGPDQTGHPDGAWWTTIDASPSAIVSRLTEAGLSGGVLVQAVGAHGFDNRFVLETATALGNKWRAVVAVGGEDSLVADVISRAAAAGAAGVRLFSIPTPSVGWLDATSGQEVVALCGELGLVPVVCCLPAEVEATAKLARTFPSVEIAVDHVGFVEVGGDEGDLALLAKQENVVLKISTGVFDHSALTPAATVDRLIDLVGADRLAWGSDHPQIRDRSYGDLVNLARGAVEHLDEMQRAAILSATTTRLWFDS